MSPVVVLGVVQTLNRDITPASNRFFHPALLMEVAQRFRFWSSLVLELGNCQRTVEKGFSLLNKSQQFYRQNI